MERKRNRLKPRAHLIETNSLYQAVCVLCCLMSSSYARVSPEIGDMKLEALNKQADGLWDRQRGGYEREENDNQR